MGQEAQLTVLLQLKDQVSAGVSKATSALSGMASNGARVASSALKDLEGAANHAWGQISGLASAVGVVGLAGGLATLGGLLKSSISDTEQFGQSVLELHILSGESAESISAVAGALQAVGISGTDATNAVGRMAKTIGAMSTKTELDFETKYGVALRTSTITANQAAAAEATLSNKKASHAAQTRASTLLNTYLASSYKDTNQLLMDAADYYNSNASEEDKAAVLSKELGRNYLTLIPLLSQGSAGISDLEAQAKSMGLTITTANLPAIEAAKDANEKWNQSISALKLQIGMALLPEVTKLTDAASNFITGHSGDIVKFFKDAEQFAEGLAKTIQDDVIPIFKDIWSAWSSLPPELRTMLIQGFAVQKTSSWLFGGGGLAGGGMSLLSGLLSSGGGGGGTSTAGLAGVSKINALSGGGSSTVSVASIVPVAIAAASIYELGQTWPQVQTDVNAAQATTNAQIATWGKTPTTPKENVAALSAEVAAINKMKSNPIDTLALEVGGAQQARDALTSAADKIANGATVSPAGITAIQDAIKTANSDSALKGATPQLQADLKEALSKVGPDVAEGFVAAGNPFSKYLTSRYDPTQDINLTVTVNTNTTVSSKTVSQASQTAAKFHVGMIAE
jgi:hypothetical protein